MTQLREAMAQAVKAPEVVKTFETAAARRLSGRAGIFKIRSGRQRAAGRGGEEDRQGGVAEPASHSFVRTTSRGRIHLAGLAFIARAESRVTSKSKERTSSKQTQRIVLSLAVRSPALALVQPLRPSQEYRGTWTADGLHARRLASLRRSDPGCQPDVACLRQNTPQLSSGCRAGI
jgi:hypothetical protein